MQPPEWLACELSVPERFHVTSGFFCGRVCLHRRAGDTDRRHSRYCPSCSAAEPMGESKPDRLPTAWHRLAGLVRWVPAGCYILGCVAAHPGSPRHTLGGSEAVGALVVSCPILQCRLLVATQICLNHPEEVELLGNLSLDHPCALL